MPLNDQKIFDLEEKCYKWHVLKQQQDETLRPTDHEMNQISYESIGNQREQVMYSYSTIWLPLGLDAAKQNLEYWSGLAQDILNHKHSYFGSIYLALRPNERGIDLARRHTEHLSDYFVYLSHTVTDIENKNKKRQMYVDFFSVVNLVQVIIHFLKDFLESEEGRRTLTDIETRIHNETIQEVEERLECNLELGGKLGYVQIFQESLKWEIRQKFADKRKKKLQNMLRYKAVLHPDILKSKLKSDRLEKEKELLNNVTPSDEELAFLSSDFYDVEKYPRGRFGIGYIWECLYDWDDQCWERKDSDGFFWYMVKSEIRVLKELESRYDSRKAELRSQPTPNRNQMRGMLPSIPENYPNGRVFGPGKARLYCTTLDVEKEQAPYADQCALCYIGASVVVKDKEVEMKPLMSCSNCKLAWYCSKECQRAHWKAGHRKICKKKLAVSGSAERKEAKDMAKKMSMMRIKNLTEGSNLVS